MSSGAWTTPVKTWTFGYNVKAVDMNAEVKDRMNFLFDPPSANATCTSSTVSATSWTAFGGSHQVTVTTVGGRLYAMYSGSFELTRDISTSDGEAWVSLLLDDVQTGPIIYVGSTANGNPFVGAVSIFADLGTPTAGSHTVKVAGRVRFTTVHLKLDGASAGGVTAQGQLSVRGY